MPRPRTLVLLLIGLPALAAGGPAVAHGAASVAPPGNSAVDQYRESVPPASSNARKLSRKARAGLERQGDDGAALAAVLERSGGVPRSASSSNGDGTARPRTSTASGARQGGGGSAATDRPAVDETAVADPVTRSVAPAAASTVGPVPVWALLVAAVAIVGAGLVVRTRAAR